MTVAADASLGSTLEFGLFYFGVHRDDDELVYRRFLESSRLADRLDLGFVSIPERHFHEFGGAFPNPALVAAATVASTERIHVRAGSAVGPLSETLRLAEDWALLDRLSGGRVAVSLGSGWSVNDFVLAHEPAAQYRRRKEIVLGQIAELRHLWRGGSVQRTNAAGNRIEVSTFPRPSGGEIPLWLTTGGSDETFRAAGRLGVNVLTHLERQDLDALARRIATYRTERARNGFDPDAGIVTLMQHTLISKDAASVPEVAGTHLARYLRSALDLERKTIATGGRSSGGAPVMPIDDSESSDHDAVVAAGVTRYLGDASLIGTLNQCRERAFRYMAAGVNEIACLVDFVDDHQLLTDTIQCIAELQEGLRLAKLQADTAELISRFNAVSMAENSHTSGRSS